MIPLKDQIAEARREVAMRVNVYPKFIKSGRMTLDEANKRTDNMRAVVATLERLERFLPFVERDLCPGDADKTVRQCVDADDCGCIYGCLFESEAKSGEAA